MPSVLTFVIINRRESVTKEMDKKAILAVLMACLMLVVTFSAISVSADNVSRKTTAPSIDSLSENKVTLTIHPFKDKNGNAVKDLGESTFALIVVTAAEDEDIIYIKFGLAIFGRARFSVPSNHNYNIGALTPGWVAKYYDNVIFVGDKDRSYNIPLYRLSS